VAVPDAGRLLNTALFTPEERARLRSSLLERAAHDIRLTGAAITGSAADGREDRWSDIDLAFGVAEAADVANVLADWTAHMYEQHLALHHCDVRAGAWIYRVFLLPGTLQIDLAFVPASDFCALTTTFRLVSGRANEPRHAGPPAAADLIGLGWLYALHARSSIARGSLWQAEYMISGVRDHGLALASIRHGLPAAHGRGIDRLPDEVKTAFEGALVRHLETAELSRAFRAAVAGLLREIHCVDPVLAARLEVPLRNLTEVSTSRSS
jgi:hypothetical protein